MKKIKWYIIRWFRYNILKPNYQKFYGSFDNYCKQRKLHERRHKIN